MPVSLFSPRSAFAASSIDNLAVSVQAHVPNWGLDFAADVVVRMTARFPGERIATFPFNRVSHAPEKYLEARIDCRDASVRISPGGVARFKLDGRGKRAGPW
jgi:hypothetical protein